ncbi:FtsK/SpoIIIE domain-containing protein [Actinomyces trachealis]|uniref:FtsK/SpoIIIE domain-containing protein n=1 Tax=Actinomyces trachealis TaxID=2763540 RepID=UPI0018C6D912|nr:FtsK/SpoIIIE domain-containing protein [Actinomyces trachealis]
MLTAGGELVLGHSLLQLRQRPTDLHVDSPAPSRRWTKGSVILPLLMLCAMGGGLLLMLLRPQGGRPWLGLVTGAPIMLMMVVRMLPIFRPAAGSRRPGAKGVTRRRRPNSRVRQLVPDLSHLLLAVASQDRSLLRSNGASGVGERPELSAWLDAAGTQVLTLSDGDQVALRGQHCEDALAWWLGQVLAAGNVQVKAAPAGFRLGWAREIGGASQKTSQNQRRDELGKDPEVSAPARSCEALLLVADGERLPELAVRVVDLQATPPSPGPSWWSALARLAGLAPSAWLLPSQREAEVQPVSQGRVSGPRRLDEVVDGTDWASIRRRWKEWSPGCMSLPARLGVGAADAGMVDLVSEGPHALVAGTTGSGKSELLLSWIAQLALNVPPSALSFVLVDYKGGAAFGPLARLPHTAGVLTDLDGAGTMRALASMEAEVRRRERLLATFKAKDLAGLPVAEVPARLVVVVDEFATMAAQHPEVLSTLVRLASQGRSLGIHLVLASQRPGEGLSPTIRANTSLRVCLRVLEPQDSRDLLGHDGAYRLPPEPGAFMMAGVQEMLRAAWCGPEAELNALVEAVCQAAVDQAAPWRPWAEPLPQELERPLKQVAPLLPGQIEAEVSAGPDDGLLLARTDLPEQQSLGWWRWDQNRPLLVLGSPGSGRSTALWSAGAAALARGEQVHMLGGISGLPQSGSRGTVQELAQGLAQGLAKGLAQGLAQGDGAVERTGCLTDLRNLPRLGTMAGLDDPRRVTRLLQLAATGGLGRSLLLVDDVDHVIAAVDEQLGIGEGTSLLGSLLRAAPAFGTSLMLSAPLNAATSRWASSLGLRLVMGASQPFHAATAGLPRGVQTGKGAGRGVVLDGDDVLACQVLLPTRSELQAAQEPGRTGQQTPPLRLQPLPGKLLQAALPTGAWGVGGDLAEPLLAPAERCVLVVGPPGSGRSTALAALAQAAGPTALVCDDLDLADPGTAQQVEAAICQGVQVLASATTERAFSSYRGPMHLLRERADLVTLWPLVGPASQLAGVNLRPACDARRPTLPGRGVLVSRGTVLAVQIALPDTLHKEPTPAPRTLDA